jgi:cholesterol transport system auxiliary component
MSVLTIEAARRSAGSERPLRAALAAALACLLAAGCTSSSTSTTFDLSAPQRVRDSGAVRGQIAVNTPTALQVLEAERILVKDRGAVSFLSGAQWADQLPRLIQARLIQTFENGSRLKAVSRPGDRIVADYQLNSEIRSFQIDAGTREAVVEISVKLVNDRAGKIVSAKVFRARVPVAAIEAGPAAQALDRALSSVLVQIVRWA